MSTPLHRQNYPRVTSILGQLSKDGLTGWALSMMRKAIEAGEDPSTAMLASENFNNKAAKMGTEVHDIIEKIINGEEFPLSEDENPAHIFNGVSSWLKWKEERNFEPISAELKVFSDKHGYRGTLDCIGKVDGKLVVLDWKTSNSIRDEYRLQGAAYFYALKEMCLTIPGFADKLGLSSVHFEFDQSTSCALCRCQKQK